MKINCLTYLLDLWQRGHRFQILYNDNHCIGVNKSKIFELGCTFKEEITIGYSFGGSKYIKLEEVLSSDTVIKVFKLDENNTQTIKEYYEKTTT